MKPSLYLVELVQGVVDKGFIIPEAFREVHIQQALATCPRRVVHILGRLQQFRTSLVTDNVWWLWPLVWS
jgi:hypothetical protein